MTVEWLSPFKADDEATSGNGGNPGKNPNTAQKFPQVMPEHF
jgi:hypothetical protein